MIFETNSRNSANREKIDRVYKHKVGNFNFDWERKNIFYDS